MILRKIGIIFGAIWDLRKMFYFNKGAESESSIKEDSLPSKQLTKPFYEEEPLNQRALVIRDSQSLCDKPLPQHQKTQTKPPWKELIKPLENVDVLGLGQPSKKENFIIKFFKNISNTWVDRQNDRQNKAFFSEYKPPYIKPWTSIIRHPYDIDRDKSEYVSEYEAVRTIDTTCVVLEDHDEDIIDATASVSEDEDIIDVTASVSEDEDIIDVTASVSEDEDIIDATASVSEDEESNSS